MPKVKKHKLSRREIWLGGSITALVYPLYSADANATKTFEDFGATGDGVADDTLAINRASAWSAKMQTVVFGKPRATYNISTSGELDFVSPSGTIFRSNVGIVIPDGARLDFNHATVRTVGPIIGLCNANPVVGKDRISVVNLRIDARQSVGTVALFSRCSKSRFASITIINSTENAICFAALIRCTIDGIVVNDAIGTAISLGGNTVWQLQDCIIGSLIATNIRSLGTFNQPGNPFVIGATRSSIKALHARNCGGGIKFTSNCKDIVCGELTFDGDYHLELDLSTENCGVKFQGDSIREPVDGITINTLKVMNASSFGVLFLHANNIKISSYIGIDNCRKFKRGDMYFDDCSNIHVLTATIRIADNRAIVMDRAAGRVQIRSLEIKRTDVLNIQRPEAIFSIGGLLFIKAAKISHLSSNDVHIGSTANQKTQIHISYLNNTKSKVLFR